MACSKLRIFFCRSCIIIEHSLCHLFSLSLLHPKKGEKETDRNIDMISVLRELTFV